MLTAFHLTEADTTMNLTTFDRLANEEPYSLWRRGQNAYRWIELTGPVARTWLLSLTM